MSRMSAVSVFPMSRMLVLTSPLKVSSSLFRNSWRDWLFLLLNERLGLEKRGTLRGSKIKRRTKKIRKSAFFLGAGTWQEVSVYRLLAVDSLMRVDTKKVFLPRNHSSMKKQSTNTRWHFYHWCRWNSRKTFLFLLTYDCCQKKTKKGYLVTSTGRALFFWFTIYM